MYSKSILYEWYFDIFNAILYFEYLHFIIIFWLFIIIWNWKLHVYICICQYRVGSQDDNGGGFGRAELLKIHVHIKLLDQLPTRENIDGT